MLALGPDDAEPRDVFNEAPRKEDRLVEAEASRNANLGTEATLHTTLGDIRIKLFPEECPRTVENFSCVLLSVWLGFWTCVLVACEWLADASTCSVHSRKGTYNDVIFHRVIKNFMIQTGDPLGGSWRVMCVLRHCTHPLRVDVVQVMARVVRASGAANSRMRSTTICATTGLSP